MIPTPPCWASAIASADSVTVSIAAETMGILRSTRRLSRLVRPGQSFAVVSGPEELPPPDHPVHDW